VGNQNIAMIKIISHFHITPLLGIFTPEQPDRTWLCARLTRAPKAVESSSKAQKTWQVFYSAIKRKIFWLGLWIFCE